MIVDCLQSAQRGCAWSGREGSVIAWMVEQRCEGAGPGRPWSLTLEDRVLLVAAYWRTNLGVSKSAADRIIDDLGPSLALPPRRCSARAQC